MVDILQFKSQTSLVKYDFELIFEEEPKLSKALNNLDDKLEGYSSTNGSKGKKTTQCETVCHDLTLISTVIGVNFINPELAPSPLESMKIRPALPKPNDQVPVEQRKSRYIENREIFNASKLRKRIPRLSFDISELSSCAKEKSEEFKSYISSIKSASVSRVQNIQNVQMTVSPSKSEESSRSEEIICDRFLRITDKEHVSNQDFLGITANEKLYLRDMIAVKLELASGDIVGFDNELNYEVVNTMLSESKRSFKRTEELLKKNFKANLYILLDQFKTAFLPDNKGIDTLKKMFLRYYFGDEEAKYHIIFKSYQMSRNFFKTLFSNFPKFRDEFRQINTDKFISHFQNERKSKTLKIIREGVFREIYSNNVQQGSQKRKHTPWRLTDALNAQAKMAAFF